MVFDWLASTVLCSSHNQFDSLMRGIHVEDFHILVPPFDQLWLIFQATLVRSAGKNLEDDAPARSLRKVAVGRAVGQLAFCYWIIAAIGSVSQISVLWHSNPTKGMGNHGLIVRACVMMKSLMIMDHRHESWSSTSKSHNKSSNILVTIRFDAINFLS